HPLRDTISFFDRDGRLARRQRRDGGPLAQRGKELIAVALYALLVHTRSRVLQEMHAEPIEERFVLDHDPMPALREEQHPRLLAGLRDPHRAADRAKFVIDAP